MENIKLKSSDYSRLEETQKLVNSLNAWVLKYNKDTKNKENELKNINSQINKKNKSIEKANDNTLNFTKKLEELESIKSSAKVRVKELEKEKTGLSFSDSDVQKMEMQELNEQISSKHSKINKLSTLIASTKDSINNNNRELGDLKNELATLESAKIVAEKSLERTNALIKLVNETAEKFVEEVKHILSDDFLKKEEKPEIKEEPKKEIVSDDMKESLERLMQSINSFSEPIIPKEEPVPEIKEEPKEEIKEDIPVEESNINDTDFSILDEWKNELDNKNDDVPVINELENKEKDKPIIPIDGLKDEIEKPEEKEEKLSEEPTIDVEEPTETSVTNEEESEVEKLLKEEKIDVSEIKSDVLDTMNSSIDRVKDNIEVLKKDMIPMDLLGSQPDILYKIDKTDLDDLLNIITTDSDGNGMGFSADFTYYCLDELATINVDNLIDIYNQEFMNITDKSGIISLLKKSNPELGDFKNTIEANKKLLEEFGVDNTDEVEKASKRFIELDHPLFESMLNVFDKTDLVNKINEDPMIVDQILEYWENN